MGMLIESPDIALHKRLFILHKRCNCNQPLVSDHSPEVYAKGVVRRPQNHMFRGDDAAERDKRHKWYSE